jgi:CBS domain-containing protein
MQDRPIRKVIEHGKLVAAHENTTVFEAARLMKARNVGAVLVLRKERLVGIFTERDVLNRVIAEGLDPAHTRLGRVMTAEPLAISPDKPFIHALIAMQEHGFRHMPVVDAGHLVGMVSMRDALPPELDELATDIREREHIAEILA